MKALLDTILKSITTQPDAIVIDQTMEGDTEVYTITVAPDDMGRVIGKSGKVINAIRNIVHVAAIRNQKRARVKLADSDMPEETGSQPAPASDETPSSAPAEPVAPAPEQEAADLIGDLPEATDDPAEADEADEAESAE